MSSPSSSTASSWTETEESISVYFVVYSSLLAVVLILSNLLHARPVLASFLPEAGMVLAVAMLAGAVIRAFSPDMKLRNDDDGDDLTRTLLSFSPKIFFVVLLPPIIFNSGYHLRRELFLRHITPICLFACLGTAISAITIGFTLKWIVDLGLCGSFYPTLTELLTFGALISATDPVSTLAVFQSKRVDPHLFYLVFGESVLNDAVGLVMFNAMAKFVQRDNDPGKVLLAFFTFLLDFSVDFFGSLVLGLVFGVVSALVLKQVDMRTTTLLELSLYILIMYFPFLLAEIMELSGIVTILFTGIAARRYMVPNLSLATKSNADVFFRLSAHLAETSIFLELGLSVFGLTGGTEWRFVFWAILACLLGRAMNIYPITYFFNRSLRRDEAPLPDLQPGGDDDISTSYSVTPLERKDMKIPMNTAHMMWYSGLRGAVAYACCRTFPNTFEHQNQFIVATMMIVLTTVFVLGGTTELALNFLSIDMNIDENNYVVGSSRVPPMVAFMIDFENRYIMGCVVRKPAQTNGGDSEMMASSPSTSIPDDYNPYVEMTVTDHARKLKMMAYQDQQAESVYDFGK